jgi:hypothetical protein
MTSFARKNPLTSPVMRDNETMTDSVKALQACLKQTIEKERDHNWNKKKKKDNL